MKLNLGCGSDYKEDYINLDLGDFNYNGGKIKVDVAHDLNNYPYPFQDKICNEIFGQGILEHIKDLDKGISELARISKEKCKVYIEVPYFLSYFSARELNVHRFSLNSQVLEIFKKYGFRLIRKKLGYINLFFKPLEWLVNLTEFNQDFCERFPLIIPNEIVWEFELKQEETK